MATPRTVVGLISLEPWDHVWRRNQHLVKAMIDQALIDELIFVEPPTVRKSLGGSFTPMPGVKVLRPVLTIPKRAGGYRLLGAQLRRAALGRATHLWINDPVLGVHCLQAGQPTVYDVTDDWRDAVQTGRALKRLVVAEDKLATDVGTIVCSEVLRERWQSRYGVAASVIPNAISKVAWYESELALLSGPGPHVGYVGTLHDERLDINLVMRLAQSIEIGTVHLVGPNYLTTASCDALKGCPTVDFYGEIDSAHVPSVMRAMDVLILPHLITDFTLSLDAIKAYEYAASGRPVVATPTSGFQIASDKNKAERVVTHDADVFVHSVVELGFPRRADLPSAAPTWDDRAVAFADYMLSSPKPAVRYLRPHLIVKGRRRLVNKCRQVVMHVRSPHATFGRNCKFGSRITIILEGEGRIHVDDECVVDRGTTLSSAGLLTIGANSILGHGVTIAAVANVQLGRDCMLGEMVSIRDHDHAADCTDRAMRLQGSVVAPVVVGDDVWLGARVVVAKGVTIGSHTIIGAGSIVTRDLPAGVVAVGSPAKIVKVRSGF